MSNKLSDFMIELSQNPRLQYAYAADANSAMREHGLCDHEMDAVRRADEGAIYRATGATESSTVAKLIFAPIRDAERGSKKAA